MEPIRIRRQDYRTRGTYVVTIPGIHGIARLNYRHERAGLIVAERTETSDTLKGTGASLALVTRMVEDARKEGVKIYAPCTYVDEQRQPPGVGGRLPHPCATCDRLRMRDRASASCLWSLVFGLWSLRGPDGARPSPPPARRRAQRGRSSLR